MHAEEKAPDKHMEKRVMRHMFRTFVLWLISKGEAHGYELIKKIQEDGGFPSTANRLYPVLAELSGQGMVSQRVEMHGKRAKKIYRITAKGKESLERAKEHVAESPLRKRFLQEMSG